MSRYYCPFCSSRYQFHITNSEGVLICGQCGDPLIKQPSINAKQIVGLFASFAFLAPLVIMIVFAFNDFTKEKMPINFETSVLMLLSDGTS